MKTKNKVYINYYDAISCAGNSALELFESICQKKETISINTTYVKDKEVAIGQIDSNEEFLTLLTQMCANVLQKSSLEDFSSTLLVIGSSVGGMAYTEKSFFQNNHYSKIDYKLHPIDGLAYHLKQSFHFYDDISFSTACTSSANALGYAKEVIEKGIYKNVLVIGADSLSHTTVCGFSALSVLSSKPCTPFEEHREGMNVAEGIGLLLLQDTPHDSSVQLCGVGYSSDAHHMTQPHPDGKGACKAMQYALEDAGLSIEDIAYINAHGTGTIANDSSELNAIYTLFNDNTVYVSSTKSSTGHTLGAAGAIEAIICCEALQQQIIPPSKNIQKPLRDGLLFSNETIHQDFNFVLSNSFAFGGNNVSLVLGKTNDS